MKDVFRVRRMWRPRAELKDRYDVVIIGGGSHGLATAYYLAKNHGVRNVAVLEKSYIGSGAAGATRRSSARTTGRRRARPSTSGVSSCTNSSRLSSTSTSCSRSTGI